MGHPTDIWKPKTDRSIVDSWLFKDIELYLLKFPPSSKHVVSYLIIGRGDANSAFEEYGKIEPSFNKIFNTFKELQFKLTKAFS